MYCSNIYSLIVNHEYVAFGLYGTGATTVVPTTLGNKQLEWEKINA